ncbi:toll/interleukin-1 receptor domain-containing protein [Flagellimonas sp. 389]|uniref:toll/interleukin-1 receptor domain-containing protein n=1 Tax=Flagellimonas sp. 389 TaxID=2835862 RepID=UPI001BD275FE|nr:toll/interleukin-1 receptor domain-containing protein [Flagellimonas sp. 389]MBS9463513.1 toll/interleukin-1 receptor domain-containing protein [Flagellimonas sp. 389]
MVFDKQIFISYSWKNRSIADEVEKYFYELGIRLVRDVRDLDYKGSLKKFMQKITESDYALVIISDDFLKSSNCMYEAIELLSSKTFKNQILPIIVDGSEVFNIKSRSNYLLFWENEIEVLEEQLRSLKTISKSDSIFTMLNHYKDIRDSIDGFLEHLSIHNHYYFDDLKKLNYEPVAFPKNVALPVLGRC